jgi:nitrite reductase/ring-hydroxylating ferredoxin subunit
MTERILIGSSDDFPTDTLKTVEAGDLKLVIARLGDGSVCAAENKCPHLGLSFNRGTLDGQILTCPWHGSEFNICSGENVDWVNGVAGIKMPGWSRKMIALGKAPAPLTTVVIVEEDGQVFVEQ